MLLAQVQTLANFPQHLAVLLSRLQTVQALALTLL
jgi:hypothetical protein